MRFPFAVDIKWRMTSVSEVDWKIDPVSINFFFNVAVFVRLPLWAIDIPPIESSENKGWTFFRADSPVVPYRLCPIAVVPFNLLIISESSKTSETWPMPLCA